MRTPVPTASTRDDRNAVRVPASTVRTLSHSNGGPARVPRRHRRPRARPAPPPAHRPETDLAQRRLDLGTSAAAMLSSVTPRPASRTAAAGSPASSPHTPTQRPWAAAPATVACTRRSTAGWGPASSAASRASPRSAAIVYWVRSLVPSEKKSTWGGQARGGQRRRRDLDHDPQLERRVDPVSAPGLVEQLPGGADLGRAWPPSAASS